MTETQYPHIFLPNDHDNIPYTPKSARGGEFRLPKRNRQDHAEKLKTQLSTAWEDAQTEQKERLAVSIPAKDGVYLEFKSQTGMDLAYQSLEDLAAGIRILNVQTEVKDGEDVTKATIYVPIGKISKFLNKIDKYASEDSSTGKPKNEKLVNGIEDIQVAVLESLWSDQKSLLPEQELRWCEAWLRTSSNDTEISEFLEICQELSITVKEGALNFPERSVMIIKASNQELKELMKSTPHIAEFRLAKETARFWMELNNEDQSEWVQSLLDRVQVTSESNVAISILDTGVNNGHPLLAPVLNDNDCHTVEPDWGTDDQNSHGTLMAGLAAYGDIKYALEGSCSIEIPYLLESIKILRQPGNDNEDHRYGYLTQQAISRVQIEASNRKHIACMAVTSVDGRDAGKPSSWSAAIDAVTAGVDNEQKNLFIVSAGNIWDSQEWKAYPQSNLTNMIHDPAQSWNAITVGAITFKNTITDPDCSEYKPIAEAGQLSPFSTTSYSWEANKWPSKPDIVFEGGNAAIDNSGFISELDDLSLLSTCFKPQNRQFDVANATSAATAQAARMAANIQASYPDAWPETIRALMVHSAEWTDEIKKQFSITSKTDYAKLLRICGYGVPHEGRAISSTKNSLTLIAQETMQPFDKKESGGYRTRDMHLFELPWPKDVLLGLGETQVRLKITLSYFIEPGPGAIGWKDRYRYPSHGLRFDLITPNQDKEEFIKRLNVAARDEGETPGSSSGSERWKIGTNGRNFGSIHSDIWEGTAADISSCNIVGIYPTIGWWRERNYLGKWDSQARYSLIVSLETPEQDIDIYTPVATSIQTPITI